MQPQITLDWRIVLVFLIGLMAAVWATYAAKARARNAETPDDSAQKIETQRGVILKQANAIDTMQTLLYEKQEALEILRSDARQRELADAQKANADISAQSDNDPIYLLVAVGRDPMFQLDLVAMRKVRAKTGIRWQRLYPVTKRKLVEKMARDNLNHRPIKNLHFSLHCGEEGLEFDDGIASPQWLSENVQGAETVVIAGCQSDTVGDYLGVATAVITMLEEVRNDDAARFTEAFWTQIGEKMQAEEAFYKAIEIVPQVSEFAEYHG